MVCGIVRHPGRGLSLCSAVFRLSSTSNALSSGSTSRFLTPTGKERAMASSFTTKEQSGSEDLRLPDTLRGPLLAHLNDLRERYRQRGWAGRVGFGQRPAV